MKGNGNRPSKNPIDKILLCNGYYICLYTLHKLRSGSAILDLVCLFVSVYCQGGILTASNHGSKANPYKECKSSQKPHIAVKNDFGNKLATGN